MVSPGVPVDSPALNAGADAGRPRDRRIELAAHFLQGQDLAITGSNGKTTTTTLLGEILAKAGFPTSVGGNIGTPAISLVDQRPPKPWSYSKFELPARNHRAFPPKIAVVLNITPDHLDRHRTFEAYADAKARIFENQDRDDFAVLNADDPARRCCRALCAQVYWF